MITDARVFQDEFVPSDVVHRDAEINYLSSTLRPITDGNPIEPVCLFGPSGTGKTCLAQYTVEQLREEVIDLNTQYVNCWEDHSRFKTLYRILDGIGNTLNIHRQSTPTDVLLDRLRDYDGPPYVVILDEADQLETKDLLYDLRRVRNLNLLLIANEETDLFAHLDERVASRLQPCTRICFDTYSDEDLVSILQDRVRWGLHPDVITSKQLRDIADAAAGDARVAIGVLRVAARAASHDDAHGIRHEHIKTAVAEAKAEIKRKTEEKLTHHQQVLYDIITERGEVAPGPLYEAYAERIDDPKTKRTMRNYLKKLEHYNLITAVGNDGGREYHLHG